MRTRKADDILVWLSHQFLLVIFGIFVLELADAAFIVGGVFLFEYKFKDGEVGDGDVRV